MFVYVQDMVSGAVMEVGQNALKIVCSIKKDIVIVLNLRLEEIFAQERIKSLNTVLKEIVTVRCINFDISSVIDIYPKIFSS